MKVFTAAIIAASAAASAAVAAVLLTRRQQPAETPAAPRPSYLPPTMYDGQSMYGDPEAVEALFPKIPPPPIEIEEEPEPRYNRFQFRYRVLNELSRLRDTCHLGSRDIEGEIFALCFGLRSDLSRIRQTVEDEIFMLRFTVDKIAAALTPPEVAPAKCQDHPEPTPTPSQDEEEEEW